jgi:hypothetical protein
MADMQTNAMLIAWPLMNLGPSAVAYNWLNRQREDANDNWKTHEWCRNAGRIANGQLQACGNSALAVPGVVGRQPGQRYPNNYIQSHGGEETAKVLDATGSVADEDGVADSAYQTAGHSEDGSALSSVGQPGNNKVCDGAQSITGDREGLDLLPVPLTETPDDGREER